MSSAIDHAIARIEWATDPANPMNIARARIERQRRRTARRAFVNECLKQSDGYWIALNWLSSGFDRFLSMDEAVRRIRGAIHRHRMNMAAGRTHYLGPAPVADLKFRLVIATYFARHGRELLAREAA